ncbi:unnamed protein product [Closterium sp. Naga37s-1]|nr:unnamed protein product [Closterium sp. Naga37s-1]
MFVFPLIPGSHPSSPFPQVPWLHADLLQRVPAFPTAPAPSAAAAAAAGPGSSTMRPSASPVAIASARTAALRSSLQHLASFLDSMDRLRVPLESERSDVVRAHALAASTAGSGGNGNGNGNGNGSEVKDLDATAKRALKVQRFKRERELKGRLEAIRRRKAERQQRVRKARPGAGAQADAGEDASADGAAVGSGLEDDDDDDEVDEREVSLQAGGSVLPSCYLRSLPNPYLSSPASPTQSDRSGTTANPFAPEALDDRLRKREGSHRAAAAAAAAAAAGGRQLVPPQAIACATLAQDVIEGRVPREEIANHRHTAPMVFGPMSLMSAAAKRGPGSGSVLGGITGSMSGSGSAAARDPLASLRVFQPSHSVARMSIEEAGEREMAMMAAWKERTRKEMEEQGMIVREDDGKGQGKGEDGEDEVDEEEEERRMGGRYLDDEEDVDKARKWDDYTDDHRRGSGGPGGAGMMMGMGGGMGGAMGGAMGYPGGGGMPRGGPGGGGMHMGGGPRALPVVKLRGLPFSCEEGDVAEFFAGLDVVDVLFLRRDSKFSGEALVVFGNAIQAELSLQVRGGTRVTGLVVFGNDLAAREILNPRIPLIPRFPRIPRIPLPPHIPRIRPLQRNRMSMGRRYVEIFRCKRADYYNAVANEVAQDGGQYKGPGARRARGQVRAAEGGRCAQGSTAAILENPPVFSSTPTSPSHHTPSLPSPPHLIHSMPFFPPLSRPALVPPPPPAETQGHQGAGRMGGGRPYRGYGEGGGGGMDGHPAVEHTGVLKLRGIPYSATKQDIVAFFDGFPLSESSVHIVVGADGRSTGEAFAEFASPGDAAAAMGRDRSRMGTRYVELFASSREEAARGVAKAK